MMNIKYIIGIVIVALLILSAGVWYASQPPNVSPLDQRLAVCGSLPNGSTQNVMETTRMFINIPKDLYPDVNLQTASQGATASYISNGGPYGNAIGAQDKSNCWSYYFEFDGTGTVDLVSKSGMGGIPDYTLHFVVSTSTNTQPKACSQIAKQCPDGSYVGPTGPNCDFVCPTPGVQNGNGTLKGTMTIGPICPVEQIGHPCNPTPQMYAAHQVFVYNSDRTKLITTLTPDAQGNFSATLPTGTYLIDVQHQSVGAVRGAPTTIHVSTGQTVTFAVNIDTGIR